MKAPKHPNTQTPKETRARAVGYLGHWGIGSFPRKRRGLSLLEVILALAILALSMAAIGELIRIGSISAAGAEDATQAQIFADSKLAEIMAGAVTPDPVTRVPFPNHPDWYYTIELNATEETEVMELRVMVETHIQRLRPLAFTLVRWIPDPGIELPAEEQEAQGNSQNSATNNNSTTTPSSGSGSGNGSGTGGGTGGGRGGRNGSSSGNSGGNGPAPTVPSNLPGNLPTDIPGGFGNGSGGRR